MSTYESCSVLFIFITSNVYSSITPKNNTAAFQKGTINNGMTPHVAEEARQDV